MNKLEKISNEELCAMLTVLEKRVEKLEGKKRSAPHSSFLNDLREKAQELLRNWH